MDNLRLIAEGVIKMVFPELDTFPFTIGYKELDDSYLKHEKLRGVRYRIDIDPSLKDAKDAAVAGGLAREFSQIYRKTNKNWLTSKINFFLYNLSNKYRMGDERETDMLVVKRGFGWELLEFLMHTDEKRKKGIREKGLNIQELKGFLEFERLGA